MTDDWNPLLWLPHIAPLLFLPCTQALALYMGHSIEMQRGTYDRRTKQQKVEPAVSGGSVTWVHWD